MSHQTYTINQDFTIQGHWERPGGKYRPAGELRYSREEIELSLLGAFDDADGSNPFQSTIVESEPPVIYGETSKGEKVTLLRSFYTNWQLSGLIFKPQPHTVRTSRLISHALLIGTHLESAEEECFSKCTLTIPNFSAWLNDRPFQISRVDDFTTRIEYTSPRERCFQIPTVGEIKFRSSEIQSPGIWDTASIHHRTLIDVIPETPKKLDWMMQIAWKIENLLTLVMGGVVQPSKIELIRNNSSVSVFRPQSQPIHKAVKPSDFLLRYSDIEAWFSEIMRCWFLESEEIRHALNLVFSTLANPGPYIENRFLPFIQAIEVFSRSVNISSLVEKSVYTPIRKAIINAIPEDTPPELRKAIERSLENANEPSLRERCRSLIASLSPELVELFCVKPEDFIAGLVDTRNHFTHYSRRPRAVLHGLELQWATAKLQTMIKLLLLQRLGIPASELLKIFSNNRQIREERRVWQTVSETGS